MPFPAVIDWNVVGAIAGGVGALATIVFGLYTVLSGKKLPILTRDELARDRNYLHELKAYLTRYQPAPLRLREEEQIASTAEIKPNFTILSLEDRPGPPPKGTLTRDLVARLIRAKRPYVVLGEPGGGKSVTLRRAAADIAERELRLGEPRLPVYVRMGSFTAPLEPADVAFREHMIQALRNTGVQGARIAELFLEYLRQGRFIFLLDGIDEMPRSDYGLRFNAVAAEVRNSANNIFVLACRSYDFRELLPVTLAEIRPFADPQIRQFLKRSLGNQAGRHAADGILRSDSALRDMASNPFFLKLISQYAKSKGGSLPQSRAEVMRALEDLLLRDEPGGADAGETLRLVLARLAFLMTSGGAGVTLPESALRKRFRDEPDGKWNAAAPPEAVVSSAIDRAIGVNLLMTEGRANGGDRILTFSHHRLQEYYTAQYLHRFDPPLDWSAAFENIWWRETMILLFGISGRPMETLSPLLGSIPEQPIVIPQLAGAVKKGLLALNRGDRSQQEEIAGLRALDDAGFYGIKSSLAGDTAGTQLRSGLRWILGPAIDSMKLDALPEGISAEPDSNASAQVLRRWLRAPQQRLLDRLELAVDCVRNGSPSAALDLASIVRPLAALIQGGNDGEKVQAIEIVARIPRFDAYGAVEPALMGASAWPRREALMALMEARVGFQGKQIHLPLLLFLQFVKGETLAVLPKYARACIQSPRLLRLAPVIAVFALFSLAGALLPAAIPFAVAAAYPSWARWIWIPAVPLTAILYYRKLKYSEPIAFRSLLAVACLALAPVLSLAALHFTWSVHVPEHFGILLASVVFAAALLLPQVVEVSATFVSALAAAILSWSAGPLSAWRAYSRDSVFSRHEFQRILLVLCGILAVFQLAAGIGVILESGAVWMVGRFALVRALLMGGVPILVTAGLGVFVWDAVRKWRQAMRNPRAAARDMGRHAVTFGKGAGLLALGCAGFVLVMVILVIAYQATASTVQSHPVGAWLGTVAVVLCLSLALLLRALPGGVLRPLPEERGEYERMTAAERLEAEWQALSHTTSKWERTFRYLRIARAYKATRQDRSAALNSRDIR